MVEGQDLPAVQVVDEEKWGCETRDTTGWYRGTPQEGIKVCSVGRPSGAEWQTGRGVVFWGGLKKLMR